MPAPFHKCPTCSALLDEEDLFCGNCGTEAPRLHEVAGDGTAFTATHNFICQGCGASMSYDASAQNLRCPFCGSERLNEQPDDKILRPQAVVPFAISQHDALARLRQWQGSSFWRPGDLARTATVTSLTQVYLPFWSFAADVETNWTADSSQTPPGARGDWVPLAGENRASYRGLLIGASGTLTPAETHALLPFDLSAAVPTDNVDLDNVVYERFRVQRRYARPLAQAGLEARERQACGKYVPGRCRNLRVNLRVQGLTSEPVLLPVWIMAYQYRERLFRFLVNGQTGQCTGAAPTSYSKIAVAVAIALTLILAGALCAGLLSAFQ